jgi:PAS domain S-box-containing protein
MSIRFRLRFILLTLTTIPILLAGVILTLNSYTNQRSQALALQHLYVEYVQRETTRFLTNTEQELYLASRLNLLQAATPEQQRNALSRLQRHNHIFRELYLLDADGQLQAYTNRLGTRPDEEAIDLSEQDVFQTPLSQQETYFSPVSIDANIGEPTMMIGVPVLDFSTGAVAGVLIGQIRFKEIWDFLAAITPDDSTQVYIIDNQNTVIAHSNSSIVLQVRTATPPPEDGIFEGLEGNSVMVAAEQLKLGSRTFTIFVEQPVEIALAAWQRNLLVLVSTLLGAILLAAAVSFVIVPPIIQPLEHMARTARKIQAGDLSQRTGIETNDELGLLGSTFDEMATSLETHYAQLEETIEQRTRALRASEERYRGIVEDQSELICRFRRDGSLTFANGAYRRLLHGSDSAIPLSDMRLSDCMHSDSKEKFIEQIKRISKDQPFLIAECQFVAANQKTYWLEWSLRLLDAGEEDEAEIQGVGRDITERKENEKRLELMLNRETELSNMRSRFLSMASHDLRNPLAVIQSSIGLLSDYGDRITDEKKIIKFEQINASIETMKNMLNDILVLEKSQNTTTTLAPERFDIKMFCDGLLDEFSVIHDLDPIAETSYQIDNPFVFLDKMSLRHVLSNLLSNAIKYSDESMSILFAVRADKAAGQIHIKVQDHGIGIPENDQEKLFQAFHRAANVGRTPGTGLGLSIVQQAVDALGGSIAFDSVEGKGTTFIVTLPRTMPTPNDAD